MGIFDFFAPSAETSIKLDFELKNEHRARLQSTVGNDKSSASLANPSLTSAPTGRVFFQPDLLSLSTREERTRLGGDVRQVAESIPIYHDGECIKGTAFVKVPGRAGHLAHHGIKIEFLGVVNFPAGIRQPVVFCTLSSTLAAAGQLEGGIVTPFPFEFKHVEMAHESYSGRQVQIRYVLRVTIKKTIADVVDERVIWVQAFDDSIAPSSLDDGWQLDIGLENQLHISFTAPKQRYALTDHLCGTLDFSLVNLHIKSADLSIVRREMVGSRITDQEVLLRYQVIDGPPRRHDSIPFRLPLANLRDLTPTLRDVEKSASLLYFVNLIMYDDQGRRYFKQQEIELHRRPASSEQQPVSLMSLLVQ